MKKVFIALASLGALTAAMPAQAALLDYAVFGTLVDGTAFNGSFTVDDTKSRLEQFSNPSLNIAGKALNVINGIGTNNSSFFYIYFTDARNSTELTVGFNGLTGGDFKILDLKLGALNRESTTLYNSGMPPINLANGTVALASTAAVPEPATWAMMMLGFGAVGYAMRRRKAVVRFA